MSRLSLDIVRFSFASLVVLCCLGLVGCGGGTTSDEGSSQAPEVNPVSVSSEETGEDSDMLARVNETIITKDQVETEVKILIGQRTGNPDSPVPEDALVSLRQTALQGLINQALLLEEAQRRELTVPDEELQAAITEVEGSVPEDPQSPPVWEALGMNKDEFVVRVGDMLKIQKLQEVVIAEIPDATPGEIRAYYDDNPQIHKQDPQVRASHILLAFEPDMSDQDKAVLHEKLLGIREKIVGGEADFAEMAKEHSSCPSGTSAGGDLGFFPRTGAMVEPFAAAAFALEVGDISDIVETKFGYHIITTTEKKEAGDTSFEELEEKIGTFLKNQKIQESFGALLQQLGNESIIDIKPQASPDSITDTTQG